jgi:acyl-CoA reductase-like NAD-dependent aldehyde dehydrogenase
MEKEKIDLIIAGQRKFFETGRTLDVTFRLEMLKRLRSLILKHEPEIVQALAADFHKPGFEVTATESRFVIAELNHTIARLKGWTRPKRVHTPIIHFLSHSYVTPQPYGRVLVLSPWNFPFQLAFMPVVGALAAGNCVILKASAKVPNTLAVMEKILAHFPRELVAMIGGGHETADHLLSREFDYIFFTGSTRIGSYVMQKASRYLTPVSLELGGKNPCVVTADARLDYAVKRIAWGKFINCGQTCVSPDYVLVDKKVKEQFLKLMVETVKSFYGPDAEKSPDFARVISAESAERLAGMMKHGRIITGGRTDPAKRYVAPTVIADVKPGDPVMREEIFGPVLPVIEYDELSDIYPIIARHPKPLAAYIFSRNRKLIRGILSKTQSGTVGVNDTVMQIASQWLPYGGIGPSGIGRYHGRKSFETFSNMRSVLSKSNLLDVWLRYPPYSDFKTRVVGFLMGGS